MDSVVLGALVVAASVAGTIAWVGGRLLRAARDMRLDARRDRTLRLISIFASARGAVAEDARAMLAWHPVANLARTTFPEECAELDRAGGTRFPFGEEQVQAVHARWTAAWLEWEQTHHADYKLRAATLDEELGPARSSSLGRARLDAVERERLASYQRRYEEYTRVSKALQTLMP